MLATPRWHGRSTHGPHRVRQARPKLSIARPHGCPTKQARGGRASAWRPQGSLQRNGAARACCAAEYSTMMRQPLPDPCEKQSTHSHALHDTRSKSHVIAGLSCTWCPFAFGCVRAGTSTSSSHELTRYGGQERTADPRGGNKESTTSHYYACGFPRVWEQLLHPRGPPNK